MWENTDIWTLKELWKEIVKETSRRGRGKGGTESGGEGVGGGIKNENGGINERLKKLKNDGRDRILGVMCIEGGIVIHRSQLGSNEIILAQYLQD